MFQLHRIFFLMCIYYRTAATQIYTYLNTLALHAALPIFEPARCGLAAPRGRHRRPPPARGRGPDQHPGDPRPAAPRPGARDQAGDGRNARGRRSEEHTSELQSLMRISYAVLCLKKKNILIISQLHMKKLIYNKRSD